MREIVQKKFIDEVIGCASGWKVLVMDKVATRVISSALTMYDIMEKRVTLVEQLAINRQPFPEMDVIYLVTPTMESVQKICGDFESRAKAKYGSVHIFFLDGVSNDLFSVIQSNALLVSKIKTFKEIYLDFISNESSVYHFDLPGTLDKLYGALPDPSCPAMLGRKLANLCITLNEHPAIRYQGSSVFARDIATSVHQSLVQFKRSNTAFACNGDDARHDRERGQLLILDRSFDPISPLMHEYTYQAMANDLLSVDDGVISYKVNTNKQEEEKQALLNEADEFWLELRHSHIAKVIETIKERMNDIIQNNAGAALSKANGADLDITTMAAAVKKLPEYTQTMTKLGQHVAIATQCMDAFSRQGLMNLSQVEQTISTGFDEDGKEVKGAKLKDLVCETLRSPMAPEQRLRLLCIYYISQRVVQGTDDFIRQAIAAAKLPSVDQQTLTNLDKLLPAASAAAAAQAAKTGGIFSSIFKGKAQKHAPTPEGEYADTRHVCQMKTLLEQFLAGELPTDKFPATGPSVSASSKSEAKSVRKFGANSKFAKKDTVSFTGGRYMVFVAGGIAYPELRVGYELMKSEGKEVVLGGTHLISPDTYINDVQNLHVRAVNAKRADNL